MATCFDGYAYKFLRSLACLELRHSLVRYVCRFRVISELGGMSTFDRVQMSPMVWIVLEFR